MNNNTLLTIVMGVSGCGKSTLGKFIADEYNALFLEADDFHSEANRAHMASGKPLTDEMREPWIQSMCDAVEANKESNNMIVLAYSGLRRAHRQRFRQLDTKILFLHLAGPKELVLQRMNERSDHFMPSSLLDSQYRSLEPALNEPDIIEIDLTKSPMEICSQAKKLVEEHLE